MLDKTWKKMYEKAKNVQEFRQISDHLEAGGVAVALSLYFRKIMQCFNCNHDCIHQSGVNSPRVTIFSFS